MNNRLSLCLVLALAVSPAAFAEEPAPAAAATASHLSAGFEILDRAGLFGCGVHLTSPYFLWDRAAVRVRGELLFDNREWRPFWLVKAGLIGVGANLGAFMRIYGEGGVVFVFPNESFTSADLEFGGYGHFGFEFLADPVEKSHSSYFIELGATGIGLRADRWADAPLVLNGFSAAAGYRLYF